MNRQAIAFLAAGHFRPTFARERFRHYCPSWGSSAGFPTRPPPALSSPSAHHPQSCNRCSGRSPTALLSPGYCRRVSVLTGAGLALGAQVASFAFVLIGVCLERPGVAAFHPEAARQAYHASGDRRATGMSWFTVGGVVGFALAPMLTTALVVGFGDQGRSDLAAADWTGRRTPGRNCPGETAGSRLSHRSKQPTNAVRDNWSGFLTLERGHHLPLDRVLRTEHLPVLYFMNRWGQSAAHGIRAWRCSWGPALQVRYWAACWPIDSVDGRCSGPDSPARWFS